MQYTHPRTHPSRTIVGIQRRVLTPKEVLDVRVIRWRGLSLAERDFLHHLIKEGKIKAIGAVSKRVERGEHEAAMAKLSPKKNTKRQK